MVRHFKSVDAYQRALLKRPAELLAYNVSPGWVSAKLGVSRPRVNELVEDGMLDAMRTDDQLVLLRRAQVSAFARLRNRSPKRMWGHVGRAWLASKAKREAGLQAVERRNIVKLVERLAVQTRVV